MQFKKQAIFGVTWLWVLRGATQAIVLIKLSILARILSPVDFGLFALVTTSINLLETLTETGFNYAVIHFQSELKTYARTIWIIHILRGILLTIFSLLLAKFISLFFNSPNLYNLLILASFIPLINGFENPAVILFQKELKFHKEFLYRFFPVIIGAFASIYFAMLLRSANGLVYGLLIGTLSESIFSFFVIKTNLSNPFDFNYAKKLFSYSKWLTIGGIFSYLITQIDNIFVGKIFGPAILGLYDIAFKFANIAFSEITDIVSRVTFPYFATIQKDKEKLKNNFIRNVMILSIPAFLTTAVFLLFPAPIITIIFGEKWKNAASLLQILSIYGFVRAITGPAGPLFLAIGKPKILSITNIINFVFLIILIYPLSKILNVQGVAFAVVISYLLVQPYLIYNVIKFFKK